MNYIVQPHPQGLAVITWELDEDADAHSKAYGVAEMGSYYYISCHVYNSVGILVFEDHLGDVFSSFDESTQEFRADMIKAYLYHFIN